MISQSLCDNYMHRPAEGKCLVCDKLTAFAFTYLHMDQQLQSHIIISYLWGLYQICIEKTYLKK